MYLSTHTVWQKTNKPRFLCFILLFLFFILISVCFYATPNMSQSLKFPRINKERKQTKTFPLKTGDITTQSLSVGTRLAVWGWLGRTESSFPLDWKLPEGYLTRCWVSSNTCVSSRNTKRTQWESKHTTHFKQGEELQISVVCSLGCPMRSLSVLHSGDNGFGELVSYSP